jgi:L-fuconolactonase
MRRRSLLQHAAGALSFAFTGRWVSARDTRSPAHPGVPVIDTHTHFYDPTRPEGVPWPGKDDTVLYRPVLPAEFLKLTTPFGVVGTVVVEASPRFEDNAWLLELAAKHRELFGIVGNLTPGEDSFAERLQSLAKNPRYRGFRINHDRLAKGLADTAFLKDLGLVAEQGLVLDVNGGPDMPTDVARLAVKLPRLKIAVNHLANVRHDGKQVPANWQAGMRACAQHEQVCVKVSALVEGVVGQPQGTIPDTAEYYRPALDFVWKAFGEDRLVYGSNWPVSARYAPYETVQKIAAEYFTARGQVAAEKFFAKNAERFYAWTKG